MSPDRLGQPQLTGHDDQVVHDHKLAQRDPSGWIATVPSATESVTLADQPAPRRPGPSPVTEPPPTDRRRVVSDPQHFLDRLAWPTPEVDSPSDRATPLITGLLVLAAGILALFGLGGIVWRYVGDNPWALTGPPPWWLSVGVVGGGFALTAVSYVLWRRRRPAWFALVATVFQLLWMLAMDVSQPVYGLAAWGFVWLASYSLARRGQVFGARLCVVANVTIQVLATALNYTQPWDIAYGLLFVLGVGLATSVSLLAVQAGIDGRTIDVLQQQHEALARHQRQHVELVLAEERRQLAHDVHDVVSHSLAVMVRLAEGAARVVDSDVEAATRALGQIADSGRQSTQDVRQLIRCWCANSETPMPPTVTSLNELTASCERLGLPVRVELATTLPSAPAFRLTLFRIIQEAVTNILRHAPATPKVVIRLSQPSVGVIDVVVDNAASAVAMRESRDEAGVGLDGLRQRVEQYHGQFEAGPTAEGGWQVHATLRVETVTSPLAWPFAQLPTNELIDGPTRRHSHQSRWRRPAATPSAAARPGASQLATVGTFRSPQPPDQVGS